MERPALVPRILRAILRILSGTVLLALALEVGARAFRLAPGGRAPGTSSPADDVTYTLHPYFQTLPPPSAETRSEPWLAGWPVDPPDAAEAGGRFRVLFLGGSTTATRYPNLVREELERALGPVTAYNLGFDWHCSLHSLYKIWTYADAIRPDLVIALEGINDLFRGFTPPRLSLPVYRPDYSHYGGALNAFWIPGRARFDGRDAFFARPAKGGDPSGPRDASLGGLLDAIRRESALLHALHLGGERREVRPRPEAPRPSETLLRALPDYERNLGNLATSCRTKGFPLLLLTMPHATGFPMGFLRQKSFFTNDDEHVLSEEDFARGMGRFNAVALALRDEASVHAMPLADAITDKGLFLDEVHLTPEGLAVEARLVARFIVDHGLLREPRNR